MERQGPVQFIKIHQGSVRGVAFHPKDRYLFCSGAYDGKVYLYSAQKNKLIHSYNVMSVSLARNINGVRFTSDGSRIISTSTSRRLAVLDVQRGDQMMSYDNCAFQGRDRTALATDPLTPHLVVCTCVNGKGLSLFDLRMPLPLEFMYDMHAGTIRDVIFLHESWPWVGSQRSLLTVGTDGLCRIVTLDGRCLHAIDVGHNLCSVAPTPELYDTSLEDGFASLLMVGGDLISAYVPDTGIQEQLTDNAGAIVWKLRYTSNGSTLYSVCDKGVVRRYRRRPDRHEYLGEVYRHRSDIEDMDISPLDEYLVTASKDGSVGIIKLGAPNHGTSEYAEFT